MKKYKVGVFPQKKEIEVRSGTILAKALQRLKIAIPGECGGAGICGKCKVKVESYDKKIKIQSPVLACQYRVTRSLLVHPPKKRPCGLGRESLF